MPGHRLSRLKAHLQSLNFPSVPLVWGKTVSCRLCAGQSKGTAKNAKKCCFFDLATPTLQILEFFTVDEKLFQNSGVTRCLVAPVLTSILTVCRQNRGDPSSLYRTQGTLQVLQRTQSFWFGLEPPTRRSRSKSAHRCIACNNRCVQNFIQIG